MLLLIVNHPRDDRANHQQDDHGELRALVQALKAVKRVINDGGEIAFVWQSVTSSSIHDSISIDKTDENVSARRRLAATEAEVRADRAATRRR